MANKFQGINCLNDSDFPIYRENLGSYGSIDVEKSRWNISSITHITQWCASYTIDGSKCILINVHSYNDKGTKVRCAFIDFVLMSSNHEDEGISVQVDKDKDFLCSYISPGLKNCMQTNNKTITTSVYVIETRSYLYKMNESKGGLLVVEEMRKRGGDKKPCKVTVAHYFTYSSGNIFSQNKIDIGLSVIVTIQQSSKTGLDVTLEGPTKHPCKELHTMFEEVMENGIWNPTLCSHCARIERLHSDMLKQVNREYNGSFQPPNGRIPHKVILVNNSGNYFKGDNNGNVVIKGHLYIFNIWDNFLETSQSIKKICKMLGVPEVEIRE